VTERKITVDKETKEVDEEVRYSHFPLWETLEF
jgi:hypothetical protein